ncbi:MAG: FHA domain-containing protein [Pirellulaceae bacterium]|jgi:adenylate cyclase|nr:FHA domain-containing protein [Pirellulaceae bacterium]MDP7014743.1 FHA domain-containing protein [Pirellulaceae bacterium]
MDNQAQILGELIPNGGGDPIPLVKDRLLVGRRESCDVVLRFSNVSAHHCQFFVDAGYWFVKDLNSRNGVKVNSRRIATRKRVDPGDTISIAKHEYTLNYDPVDLGATGPPPPDEETMHEVLGRSLMSRAGLDRRQVHEQQAADKRREAAKRYNVLDDNPGQVKRKKQPPGG